MPASWNYKKADWAKFTTQVEEGTTKFNKSLSVRQATKQLTDLMIKAAYFQRKKSELHTLLD